MRGSHSAPNRMRLSFEVRYFEDTVKLSGLFMVVR